MLLVLVLVLVHLDLTVALLVTIACRLRVLQAGIAALSRSFHME
jgi:hypothetical protein